MTATIAAPPVRPASSDRPPVPRPSYVIDTELARRTLRTLFGCALGVLPLLQLLTDAHWLVQAWICMAIVIVPAALLRLRHRAHAAQLLPGLLLLVGYLTRVYVPDHAWLGVIATRSTWSDLTAASTALGKTISDSAAPLQSTPAIRLYLSLGLVALAILLDLVVVEFNRPALAGVALLLVFTLAGAVPRDPVSWLWFVLAAGGYLIILSSASAQDLHSWGRVVARPEPTSRIRLTTALSGRRIGVVALLVAVLVPFVIPLGSVNVLANALHNGRVGVVGGNGKGSTGLVIDPLASLKGDLTRGTPVKLFGVDITKGDPKSAFYLRTTVLENYNGKQWLPGPTAASAPAIDDSFMMQPLTLDQQVTTTSFTAKITLAKLGAGVPVFSTPSDLSGIPSTWAWSSRYGLASGQVKPGLVYTETVDQLDPTQEELAAAAAGRGEVPGGAVLQQNLTVTDIPPVVRQLVTEITAGKATPYAKARALSTYFTDPTNGFVYSLQTKGGESGNDLQDFLTNKAGFCQQYAAALGVMLRLANIPARVVLGYTHPAPDASGHFDVTSDDAHAWVEAYFSGIGWLSFDPTPLVGVDAARAVALPWAPHPQVSVDSNEPAAHPSAGGTVAAGATSKNDATTTASGASSESEPWSVWFGVLAALVLLVAGSLTPWLVRSRRRRTRRRLAREIGPEPLWNELADTAVDLGLGWSDSRSPRQVAAWLEEMVLSDQPRAALRDLAGGIERGRYAHSGADQAEGKADWTSDATPDGDRWGRDLDEVRAELIAHARRIQRLRARLLPASLRRSRGGDDKPAPSVENVASRAP